MKKKSKDFLSPSLKLMNETSPEVKQTDNDGDDDGDDNDVDNGDDGSDDGDVDNIWSTRMTCVSRPVRRKRGA